MRERLRIFVAACFYYSGFVKLALWWAQRLRPGLMILNYHEATGGDLRRHLLFLRRHFRILPLEDALEELYTPPMEKKPVRDRRRSLVLTFDDGYYDNYTSAFTLARELQVPITIFLIPGYIESGDSFWFIERQSLVRRAQVDKVVIEGRTYHLKHPGERDLLTKTIDTHLRYATSVAEREAFLVMARKALDVSSSVSVQEKLMRPLTWAEVREMDESEWASFGAHTMNHPVLGYLSDAAEVQYEVSECRTVLEQRLGHPVTTFAYPMGKPEHIGDQGLRAAKAAGYKWAFTTIRKINSPQTDPYLLYRKYINVNWHWLIMASELAGLLPIIPRLKNKLK
jgi:peptidoglycan/xylan/chitin deacetylase (PgdA/CDA1 family)